MDTTSSAGIEMRVISSGLIDQLLRIINISDHKKIADELDDAIWDLHAKLSQGVKDVKKEKAALLDILEDIRFEVSE